MPVLVNWPMEEFVARLRGASRVKKPSPPRVPPEVTGIVERYLAFSVVALDLDSAGTILVAWMGAKLAANWQRQAMRKGSESYNRTMITHTMIALISGTISIALGALGGLIARCAFERL